MVRIRRSVKNLIRRVFENPNKHSKLRNIVTFLHSNKDELYHLLIQGLSYLLNGTGVWIIHHFVPKILG